MADELGNLSLDRLVAASAASVLRTIREHEEANRGGFTVNPKLWVGIWIDLDRFGGPRGPLGGPGGVPGGGQIG
jgi:hypothetical protein